jgi:hypothetical protein
LDEAFKTSTVLEKLIEQGKVIAYADDIMLMTKDKQETEEAIQAFS